MTATDSKDHMLADARSVTGSGTVTFPLLRMQIFIMISGGRTLSRIHSWQDMYTWHTMLTLAACAALSVLPVALRMGLDPAAGKGASAAQRRRVCLQCNCIDAQLTDVSTTALAQDTD